MIGVQIFSLLTVYINKNAILLSNLFHPSQIFFSVYRYYDPRETKVEMHPWALMKDHSRKWNRIKIETEEKEEEGRKRRDVENNFIAEGETGEFIVGTYAT